ncbi:MAG: FkbM family methyltransferase [Treponematales bacterium]
MFFNTKVKNFVKKITLFLLKPLYKRFDKLRQDTHCNGINICLLQNRQIIDFLTLENRMEKDTTLIKEKEEIIDYLVRHLNAINVFPYDFVEKYRRENYPVQVFRDESCTMKYVMHQNKKMYFPASWSEDYIKGYYTQISMEQDEKSPHHYLTDTFNVGEGDVVADIGAAEGVFALTVIEKASKVYLFECDSIWQDALKKTFTPWIEKVEFINKYIGEFTDDTHASVDDFFVGKRIDFIKADIEGSEIDLLRGAIKTLTLKSPLKMLLCAYHRKDDAAIMESMLKSYGFQTEWTKGYMLFFQDEHFAAPYLRRGVMRARKG